MNWLLDVLREGIRRRIGLRRALRFLRGQVGIRIHNIRSEIAGMAADLRDLRRPEGDLLLVVHVDRLRPDGFIETGLSDLCLRLVAEAGALPVRSRLGYRLRARSATHVFSVEPFTAAPPVRMAAHHVSAVLVSDTWDKTWMARHLTRSRVGTVLTPYLWPVAVTPGLRRLGEDRWRLFPWWVPDRAVDGGGPRDRLDGDITVVGALGPFYDLRTWVASHPLVTGLVRVSGYATGHDRLGSEAYFAMLREQSAVVVAFSESEWMRAPVAKYVEVPSCGALLIGARAHHLHEMGFRDGENCLIFEGREDFGEKAYGFLSRPQDFVEIAARGRALVRERHTTSARITELLELLGRQSGPVS